MGSLNESRYYGLLFTGGITAVDLETELADQNNLNDFVYLFRNYANKKTLFQRSWDILSASSTASVNSILGTCGFMSGIDSYSGQQTFLMPASTETPFAIFVSGVPQSTGYTFGATSAPLYMRGFAARGNYTDYSSSYYDFLIILDFPTKTQFNASVMTSSTNNAAGGIGMTTDHFGYFMGGKRATGPTYMNLIYRQSYAYIYNYTQISATSSAYMKSGSASGTSYGLMFGGENSGYQSGVGRFTFSTEAFSGGVATLANTAQDIVGGQTGDTAYMFGGYNGSFYSNIQKTNMSTISLSTIGTALSAGTSGIMISSLKDNAYLAGGSTASAYLNTIQRFNWSGETLHSVSATLGVGRQQGQGVQGPIT